MTTAAKFRAGDVVVVGGAMAQVVRELPRDEWDGQARVYRVRIHNYAGPDTFESAVEWWIQAHVVSAQDFSDLADAAAVECHVRFSSYATMSKFRQAWADRIGREVRDDEHTEAEYELYFIGQDDCDRARDIANEIAGAVVE